MSRRKTANRVLISPVVEWLLGLHRQYQLELQRVLLSFLTPDLSSALLDCGCGGGTFTIQIGRALAAKRIVGVDIFDPALVQARTRGIEAIKADLNRPLPLESNSFDVVTGNLVIAHLCHTDTFLREVRRVLKSGGYCVLTTPNLSALHNILFLLLGRQPLLAQVSDEVAVGSGYFGERCPAPGYPLSRRNFAPAGFKGLLRHHGFHVEAMRGVGFWPLPLPLASLACALDPIHPVYMVLKARKPVNERAR